MIISDDVPEKYCHKPTRMFEMDLPWNIEHGNESLTGWLRWLDIFSLLTEGKRRIYRKNKLGINLIKQIRIQTIFIIIKIEQKKGTTISGVLCSG